MGVGNYIRSTYMEGIGWRLEIKINAKDDEALDRAIDMALLQLRPDMDAPGLPLPEERH
jgi:hypothetical protein